jgi:putative FmdB family regulatory protein
MPIYEFQCQSCGHEFEQILPFSAQSAPPCARCSSHQVARQVGRPAIHFKGSGWYINDSKAGKSSVNGSDSKSTDTAEPASTTTTTTAEDTKKSDTKGDVKSTPKESHSSAESVA